MAMPCATGMNPWVADSLTRRPFAPSAYPFVNVLIHNLGAKYKYWYVFIYIISARNRRNTSNGGACDSARSRMITEGAGKRAPENTAALPVHRA